MTKSRTPLTKTKTTKTSKTFSESPITSDIRNPTLIREELEQEMHKYMKQQSSMYEKLESRIQALEDILGSIQKENLITIECENLPEIARKN